MDNEKKAECLICGEGRLTEVKDKNPVVYKGHSTLLDCYYSVCDSCGSEQGSAEQTRINKRAMLAFKKEVDCLLKGTEIKSMRDRLHINQQQAAKIFGGGPVAFSKYENDDVVQSEAMDKLLRVADRCPEAFSFLVQMSHLDLQTEVENDSSEKYREYGNDIPVSLEHEITETQRVKSKKTSNVTYRRRDGDWSSSSRFQSLYAIR